jgi:integrase
MSDLSALTFAQAAPLWLESRRPYLAPRTYQDYAKYIVSLDRFFGVMRLPEITAEQIRAYQCARLATASPTFVNKECSVLQQMLKRVGRWGEIATDYQSVPVSRQQRMGPGRALTEAEEARYFRAAFALKQWEVAARCLRLGSNTTAGPGELRNLRLADVDLVERTVSVKQGTKNEYRMRVIPLNEQAYQDVCWLLERSRKLGAFLPEHYLIPFRVKTGRYDVDKPASSYFLRTVHREVCAVADIKIRIYDVMRHHPISRMLENPKTSEQTVKDIAGHVSQRMLQHYSHTRMQARRAAVAALMRKKTPSPQRARGNVIPLRRRAE